MDTNKRVDFANPVFDLVEVDGAKAHQSKLRLSGLAEPALDYPALQQWVKRLHDGRRVRLIAYLNGRPVQIAVQPKSIQSSPTTAAIAGKYGETKVADACVSAMGKLPGGQAVCLSLSPATNRGSYIAVKQPVAV